MNFVERFMAPTPNFFKKVRNVGLALVAASAVVITAPVALPAGLLAVAGYISLAGGIMSAVAQATVKAE